jgi:ribosome-associated protein
MEQTSVEKMLPIITEALLDKKARDVKTLHVGEVSSVCDYFVISSGSNKSQIQAMCDHVEDTMHQAGFPMKNREGLANGGWILLDFYDIIVHIFTDEMREFYNLERTWRDAGIS